MANEAFETELQKLRLNLDNAEKTYGKGSQPCRIIQQIIDEYVKKNKSTTEQTPITTNFFNLTIRTKPT